MTDLSASALVDASASVQLGAVRQLMRVSTTEEVVGVLMDVVRDLGATVITAAHRSATSVPIDLSFGVGGPLLADSSDPRIHALLSAVLPVMMDDARMAVERIQAVDQDSLTSADPLTGLGDWTAMMNVLSRMMAGDAVAILDLDNLQQINDYYDSSAGDQVLVSFARTLRRVARAADNVGRVGGTQFVWLFRAPAHGGAEGALSRLRSVWEADRPHPVTFSAGLAGVGNLGPSEAYVQADEALRAASSMGHAQFVVAG